MSIKTDQHNSKNSLSFFYRILFSMVIIILIIAILISGFSYGFSVQTINKMELEITNKNVKIIEDIINNRFSYVEQIMFEIIETDIVRNTVELPNVDGIDTNMTRQAINNKINHIINDNKRNDGFGFDIVNLYMKNGFSCSTLPELELNYKEYNECYDYLLSNDMISDTKHVPITWTETIPVKNFSGVVEQTSLCVRFIYNSLTMEKIGVVVVGVPEKNINTLYKNIFPEAYIFQNNGTVISAVDMQKLGIKVSADIVSQIRQAQTVNGSITYKDNSKDNVAIYWRNTYNSIYCVIPMDTFGLTIKSESIEYAKKSLLVALFALIMGGIVAFLLTRSLSKSIISLKSFVQEVYNGHLETRFQPTRNDEIAFLGRHVNDMLDQIETSVSIRERDARERNKLQLQLLQSQMNPHLLYNTLNSVLLAIKSKNSAKAETLLLKLSSFFRLSLSKGNEKIKIETEIQMIQEYIAIQNLARQKSIKLNVSIASNLLPHGILRMTILPIVENSVIHGISGYRKDGEITISCKEIDEKLVIAVIDNGIGIDEEELLRIENLLNTKNMTNENKHFGLYNVNWRIKNQFGEEYGLEIVSEVSDFTKVLITLPLGSEDKD